MPIFISFTFTFIHPRIYVPCTVTKEDGISIYVVNLNDLNKSTAYVDKFESLFENHISKSYNGSYLPTRSVSMVMGLRHSNHFCFIYLFLLFLFYFISNMISVTVLTNNII